MDKKIKRNLAGLALVACVMPLQASVMTEAGSAYALHQTTQTEQQKPKNQLLRSKKKAFFKTEEARRVGDQVLLWQRDTGGWPKNVDMESPMTEEQKQSVLVRAHQARSKKEMQALAASMAELDLMSEMLRRERSTLAGGETASMEQMQTMADNILHED